MDFNSISEVISYIENIISDAMPIMGEQMTDIMKEAINRQIYDDHSNNTNTRTGQLDNSPKINMLGSNFVETEFQDNGDWRNLGGSKKHVFPLKQFQDGKVWAPGGGKYQIDIMPETISRCETDIPNELKMFLISNGIPVE